MDVPELVAMFHARDWDGLRAALMSYPDTAVALHQALWMAANVMDSRVHKTTPQDLRNFAYAIYDEEEVARKCHYCRTGEGAACECV